VCINLLDRRCRCRRCCAHHSLAQVATSVIMAWQLSRFDEWTGWALLCVLAMYDLCAVLSPCGPLKALVNLMQVSRGGSDYAAVALRRSQ
jgi:Presenilin